MSKGGGARRTAVVPPPPIESFAYRGKGEGKAKVLMEKKRATSASLAERERADICASSSSYSPVPSQPSKMLAKCSRRLPTIKAQGEPIKSCTDDGLHHHHHHHHQKKKRKNFTPSNFIRARLGDRYIISSKWLPLPEGATHPEIIDQKEMDMIWRHPGKDWRRKLAHLSPPKMRSDAYKRVYHTTWKPPPSPYKLLQETHYSDPWRVLVICLLLNITTGRQVEKVLPRLFHLCPNAEVATKVPNKEIEEVIKSCGLYQKRADDIKKLSTEYLSSNWTHVTELHSVGKYAADAYAIFCVGKPEAVVPDDHKLVDYWRFVLEKKQAEELDEKRKEANGLTMGQCRADVDCDPSPRNVKVLLGAADEMMKQKNIESVLFGGKRIGEQTNMEKLDWFAGELVLEHQRRSCRIAPTVAFKQPRTKPSN